MTTTTRSLDSVQAEFVAVLKKYLRSHAEERTPLLRQLAELLVEAREHFLRDNGTPDWKGRTYAYRRWVADLYASAGVSKTEAASIQAATRYHVGSVLRDNLDPDTLIEYGLIKQSPKDRSTERRRNRAAMLQALTGDEVGGGAALALTAAYNVLARINAEELANADEEVRQVIDITLRELDERTHTLRNRLAHA